MNKKADTLVDTQQNYDINIHTYEKTTKKHTKKYKKYKQVTYLSCEITVIENEE